MQMNTWARTLVSVQWWMGRRSRSMLLMDRKSRSTRGQRFVGRHYLDGVHLLGPDGGADDVEPVQGRLGGDGLRVAGERERVVGDVQDVVLGHLVAADDLPDPDPDLAGTGQAFTAPAGSTRSNAGSASSPTNSSAEAATPPSKLSKPTSAPGPRDGTKTPSRSSGPNPPNRSSSQSGDFLHGSPVRHTSDQ